MILTSLAEISAYLQNGVAEVADPSSFLRWIVLLMGAIAGGFAVHLVKWVVGKLTVYPMLLKLSGAIVVLGGPDLLPPLAVANGFENVYLRLFWTAVFIGINYFYGNLPGAIQNVSAESPFKVMFIVSGVWHFDRGDYHYKGFLRFCRDRVSRDAAGNFDIGDVPKMFSLYLFQAAAGIGMVTAALGVYSFGAFFKALLLFIGVQLFIYFGGLAIFGTAALR